MTAPPWTLRGKSRSVTSPSALRKLISVADFVWPVGWCRSIVGCTGGARCDAGRGAVRGARLLSWSDEAWEKARRRAAVIAPLAGMGSVSHEAADDAGRRLGLSRRQVYVPVNRYRQGSGVVTDMAAWQSSGGRGSGRLPESVESVIREAVRTR